MKRIDIVLSTGTSPRYLKKIGVNFFVAAAIMSFLMAAQLTDVTDQRTIITIALFLLGVLSFGVAHLKMKYCKKYWQEIGEPEVSPKALRRSARHFAQFGLVIVFFILAKSLVLKIFPDWFDITAIFVPFLLCLYLLIEARRRNS